MLKNIFSLVKTALNVIPSVAVTVYVTTTPVDLKLLPLLFFLPTPAGKIAEEIEKRLDREEGKKQ